MESPKSKWREQYERIKQRMRTDPAYRAHYMAKNQAGIRRMRARKRAYVRRIKGDTCSVCKKQFPSTRLHFHHRPGEVKLFNLGDILTHSYEKIEAEIAKCEVRCKKCHDIFHAEHFDQYPSLLPARNLYEGKSERYASKPEAGVVSPQRSGHRRIRTQSPLA